MRRILIVAALVAAGLVDLSPAQAAGTGNSSGVTAGDFNGDGRDDLAVGVHHETINGVLAAGVVHVIYGSRNGLRSSGSQLFSQEKPGIRDTAEEFDRFGRSLTAGDFNNDGFDDLAVGVINENAGGATDTGAVHVLYGSPSGLRAADDQLWSLASAGIGGEVSENAYVGTSLASGNLGNGPADDLVVGGPGATVNADPNAGAAFVLYGSGEGLSTEDSFYLDQAQAGIATDADAGDNFGQSLAIANVGTSDHGDLAIGAPGEEVATFSRAGAVHVLFGSNQGISTAAEQFWSEESPDIGDMLGPDSNENFGWALAAANFGDGRRSDLAIGIPGEDAGDNAAGGVVVLSGRQAGLDSTSVQFLSEDSAQAPGASEASDAYGSTLAAANFGGSKHADLAIDVPYNGVQGIQGVGIVHVVYGSEDSFEPLVDEIWHTGKPGIKQSPHQSEQFGSALVGGNFGKGARADLVATAPGDSVSGKDLAGNLNCIYGSANGLSADGDQLWHQDKPGIPQQAEPTDLFGEGLPLVFG